MIGNTLTTLKAFVLTCATLAMTQQPTDNAVSLPQCQQLCVNNMIAQASEFGCSSSTDSSCLCSVDDFLNGVKDCALQTCSSGTGVDTLNEWAEKFCGALPPSFGAATSTSGLLQPSLSTLANSISSTRQSRSLTTSLTPSSSLSPSITTSSPSSSPSTSGSPSRSSGGLSSNAKIGLAARIPCGLLAIAASVGLYFFGKHKARKESSLLRNSDTHQIQANESSQHYEIDGSEVQWQELETNANRVELPEKTGLNHGY